MSVLVSACIAGCNVPDPVEKKGAILEAKLDALRPAVEPIPPRPELPPLSGEEGRTRQVLLTALKSEDEAVAHEAFIQLTKDGEEF